MMNFTRFSPRDFERAIAEIKRAELYLSDMLVDKMYNDEYEDERGKALHEAIEKIAAIETVLQAKKETFQECTDPILKELLQCNADNLVETKKRIEEAKHINVSQRVLKELLCRYYGDRITSDCFPYENDLVIAFGEEQLYIKPVCDGRVLVLHLSGDSPRGLYVYQRYAKFDPLYETNVCCSVMTLYGTIENNCEEMIEDALHVCRYLNEHPSIDSDMPENLNRL